MKPEIIELIGILEHLNEYPHEENFSPSDDLDDNDLSLILELCSNITSRNKQLTKKLMNRWVRCTK